MKDVRADLGGVPRKYTGGDSHSANTGVSSHGHHGGLLGLTPTADSGGHISEPFLPLPTIVS